MLELEDLFDGGVVGRAVAKIQFVRSTARRLDSYAIESPPVIPKPSDERASMRLAAEEVLHLGEEAFALGLVA